MTKIFPKAQIKSRLEAEINAGRPLYVSTAGCGLTAKLEDIGKADIICVSSVNYWCLKGLPEAAAWLPIGDNNRITYDLVREVVPMVNDTPVMAIVESRNPAYPHAETLAHLKEGGVSAIAPFMSQAYGETACQIFGGVGITFNKDLQLIQEANKLDMFTAGFAYTADEATKLAEAGADMIVAHMGDCAGGLTGVPDAMPLMQAAELTNTILAAAQQVRKDLFLLCTGGPIITVEAAKYMRANTPAMGIVGWSSAERIPIEEAVLKATRHYKDNEH